MKKKDSLETDKTDNLSQIIERQTFEDNFKDSQAKYERTKVLTKTKLPIQRRIMDFSSKSITKNNVSILPTNRIVKNVLGIDFTFDKTSYKRFNEEFAEDPQWEITYDNQGCYLIRQKKNGYFEYFHRWLMDDKIEEFAKKRRISPSNVIVHHKNHEHTDNRLTNFVLMTREEHHDYHRKEKAYQNWRGNRKDFEEWYFNNHKE